MRQTLPAVERKIVAVRSSSVVLLRFSFLNSLFSFDFGVIPVFVLNFAFSNFGGKNDEKPEMQLSASTATVFRSTAVIITIWRVATAGEETLCICCILYFMIFLCNSCNSCDSCISMHPFISDTITFWLNYVKYLTIWIWIAVRNKAVYCLKGGPARCFV